MATKKHPARKEIETIICTTYDLLEQGTQINSTHFMNVTKKMSDEEFFKVIKTILENPKSHFYFEIELLEREPRFEEVEQADKYVDAKIFDYIGLPSMSSDPSHPIFTVHKIFNGYLNIRRVQQMLEHKNSLVTDISRIDPKTGQVTGSSKGARTSEIELFALAAHNTPNIAKEYYTMRSDDPVAKSEALNDIATKGNVSLKDLDLKASNRIALQSTNVFMLGACMETDLITKNGLILPRTMNKQFDKAKELDRNKTKS